MCVDTDTKAWWTAATAVSEESRRQQRSMGEPERGFGGDPSEQGEKEGACTFRRNVCLPGDRDWTSRTTLGRRRDISPTAAPVRRATPTYHACLPACLRVRLTITSSFSSSSLSIYNWIKKSLPSIHLTKPVFVTYFTCAS